MQLPRGWYVDKQLEGVTVWNHSSLSLSSEPVICTTCKVFSLAAFVPLGGNFPWKKFKPDDSDLESWSQLIHFCSSHARGSWWILSSPSSVGFFPDLWTCSSPYRLPGGEEELGMLFPTSTAFHGPRKSEVRSFCGEKAASYISH